MNGMDTDAISRKGHVCFWFRITKNTQDVPGEGPDAEQDDEAEKVTGI